MKALADENRLRIVELLADGERCICELATELDASDALVSHHVKQLREVGLVRTRRLGRWLHCSLESSAFEAISRGFGVLAQRARDAEERNACCACTTADGRDVAADTAAATSARTGGAEYPELKEEIWP